MGLEKQKLTSALPQHNGSFGPRSNGLRRIVTLAAAIIIFLLLRWSVQFMRNAEAPRLQVLLVAILTGGAGAWVLYWMADSLVSLLPSQRLQDFLRPVIFVGPAIALLLVFLVYPAISTIALSFQDKQSQHFVGFDNYVQAFTQPVMQQAFLNNVIWMVLVTSCSVALGLLVAVLFDRVRYEAMAKVWIFLPLVISFVGASVIWRFVYAYQPAGRPQTGILNALLVAAGEDPIGWLTKRQFNTIALIVIMIWLQTGFCMVVLSAALKSLPAEILDAARIDGANEIQIFFKIIIPNLKPTLITVATAVLIAVLKVFDIVYVMTNGMYNTEVIANRMYAEMFKNRNFGLGSALAVLLLLAVVPVMVANVRNLRKERG
jgi:alpha-glucoside transport system permease protein